MFQDRLITAVDAAGLSVSDAARWFDVSRTAIHYWLSRARSLHVRTQRLMERDLRLLEYLVQRGEYTHLLPVPISVRLHERVAYLEKVKEYAAKRIPTDRITKSRNEMLRGNLSEQSS